MENMQKELIRDPETLKEDKKNILIAEKIREVLKGRMLLSQKILSRDENIDTISFSEFVDKLNKLAHKLEVMDKKAPDYAILESEYYEFMNKYANNVILQEYEIDHLLRYVKQAIMRLGLPKNKQEYTCTDLIKYTLLMLNERNKECFLESDKELEKWIDLFCSSSSAGIYPNNGILFILNSALDEYFTIKQRGNKIFAISSNGETLINEYADTKNDLLIDDLYLGYINIGQKRVLTLLAKGFGYYYPVFLEENDNTFDKRKEENASLIIPLKSLLIMMGHKELIEPLYDKKMLEYIMTVISECKGFILTNDVIDSSISKNEENDSSKLFVYLNKYALDGYVRLNYKLFKVDVLNTLNTEIENGMIINLNELLTIIKPKIFTGILPDIIASQLKEDSYDYKKLECILTCIKGHNLPLSDITLDNKKNTPKQLDL